MKEKAPINQLIIHDFALEHNEKDDDISEEALTALLADRIAVMLERNIETLFSLLYRLDISEAKVREAMSPACSEPANLALARLVLERQKQRLATKASIRSEPLDEDWSW